MTYKPWLFVLPALGAVGDASGREVGGLEDNVGSGSAGGEGREGNGEELHLDGWVGLGLVGGSGGCLEKWLMD